MFIEGLGQINIRYARRKTISISVGDYGRIEVSAPAGMTEKAITGFIKLNYGKIAQLQEKNIRIDEAAQREGILSESEIEALAGAAKKYIPARTAQLAAAVGVNYGRISIRCQKTRWGSCSSEGNLNFNCLLMLCPQEVVDYVIVHELCHRKEMNHSALFWAEVEKVCPNYRKYRKWLKDNGGVIMKRAGN